MAYENNEEQNHKMLEVLQSEQLITQAQFDRAVARHGCESSFVTPGAALAWMIQKNVLSPEEREALYAPQSPGHLPHSDAHMAIKAEAREIVELAGADVDEEKKSSWGNVLTFIVLIVALVRGGMYLADGNLFSWGVPSCSSSDVTKTVSRLLNQAVTGNIFAQMSGQSRLTLSEIKEVGYASEVDTRGCTATIKIGDVTSRSYAYTISATKKSDEFMIASADPQIVKARFGNIDDDGNYGNKAEPVGRATLETLIRAEVGDGPSPSALSASLGSGLPGSDNLASQNINPDRLRAIAEIEPVAPCRAVVPATRYACKVLVERNDLLMGIIMGNSLTVATGEFTIERDSATAPWKVSKDFAAEYAAMKANGRTDDDEAAEKPSAGKPASSPAI
jgi:hypothetical protein